MPKITPPSAAAEGDRYVELESLRGVAALVVVFCHLAIGFFPEFHHDKAGVLPPWIAVWMRGDFAVDVFFVLSGFVLSLGYVRSRNPKTLQSAAVRRYLRLAVPIIGAVTASWAVMTAGLYANREAAAVIGQPSGEWMSRWFGFAPRPADAASEALWRSMLGYDYDRTYDPVLWTMELEFKGSLFVFAFLSLAGALRWRVVVYAATAVTLYRLGQIWLLEFLAGAAVCDFWPKVRSGRSSLGGIVAVAAGLLLAGASQAWLARHGVANPPLFKYWCPLAAVLVVAGVLRSVAIRRLLSTRPLVELGRLSFSLYLFHVIVECSLGCRIYLICVRSGASHGLAFGVAAAATFVGSLILAWIGSRTLEPLSIHAGRRLYALLAGDQKSKRTRSESGVAGVAEGSGVAGDQRAATAQ